MERVENNVQPPSASVRMQHQKLLFKLKFLTEEALRSKEDIHWEDPESAGKVLRLVSVIEEILGHGFRKQLSDGSPDLFTFIDGLNDLNSSIAEELQNYSQDDVDQIPFIRVREDPALTWLYLNLIRGTLADGIKYLLGDNDYMISCYLDSSFLSNKHYLAAFLMCLEAITIKRMDILDQIDCTLYSQCPLLGTKTKKTHRRTNSNPPSAYCSTQPKFHDTYNGMNVSSESKTHIRRTASMPNIQSEIASKARCKSFHRHRSYTVAACEPRVVPKFTYQAPHSENDSFSKSPINDLRPIQLVKCDDIEIHTDFTVEQASRCSSVQSSASNPGFFSRIYRSRLLSPTPSDTNQKHFSLFSGTSPVDFNFGPIEGEKIEQTHDAISVLNEVEETNRGNQNQPPSQLRRYPWEGQSIASFLQNSQFSRANTELERENAHFSLSEAMIAAIEKMKCRQYEERLARERMRIQNGVSSLGATSSSWSDSVNSDDSDYSSRYHVIGTENGKSTTESDSEELQHRKPDTDSLTALAEWSEESGDILSAENVALCLISKFSEKQLPSASELLWLVSEQDAPQKLLPIPGSYTVNPDEVYKMSFSTRGTRDWAPPRQQIIFTPHPVCSRSEKLLEQNHRCASCGIRVAKEYSHHFRYCEYLGKFMCTNCHRNQLNVIPARILCRWDFSMHPVSVFAYRLLERVSHYPLFRLIDLNPDLYNKVKALRIAKKLRQNLKFVKDFIDSCRFADEIKFMLSALPDYVTNDEEIWSLFDFMSVKCGQFEKRIKELILKCEVHIRSCELCVARGFICELCPRKEIIYPWQPKVMRCRVCGTCFHEPCWKDECSKCNRIRKRNTELYLNKSL